MPIDAPTPIDMTDRPFTAVADRAEPRSRSHAARRFVLESAAILAIYTLLVELNRPLTVPPIDIAPLWLPAGFVVGVIITRGWWTTIPIFFTGLISALRGDWSTLRATDGSDLLQSPALWAAVIFAAAVVGHAVVAKLLVDRIPGGGEYDGVLPATLLLASVGPISCVVSALLGTWSFMIDGSVNADSFAISAFTFWIGDSIGCILVAPVMIAFAGGAAWQPRRRAVTGVAALTFAIVLATTWLVGQTELDRLRQSYERSITHIADDLTGTTGRLQRATLVRAVTTSDDARASVVLVRDERRDGATTVLATPSSPGNVLIDEDGAVRTGVVESGEAVFVVRRRVSIDGESWHLVVAPSRDYLTERSFVAALVPASMIALALTLTMVVLALSSSGQRVRLERLVRRRTGELASSERRYRSVVENVREGIFQLDASDTITFVNAAWNDLVGSPNADADSDARGVGSNLAVALDVTDDLRLRALLAQARRAPGTVAHGEFETSHGGRILDVRLLTTCRENGATCPVVGTLVDVTAQRSVLRNRERFVTLIAHELRNPLTVISGSVATIADHEHEALPPLAAQLLPAVQTSAHKLDRIIEDLLVASQVDAGTLTLQIERTDLRSIARAAVASALEDAASRGIEMTTDANETPIVAACDPDRVIQVLDNLLSNAVKYTPAGGRVRISVTRDEQHDAARILVHDTGIGIAPEDQEHVFERFGRTDAGAEVATGTGLGLAICRAIAEAHDGSIEVESERGEGSTFTLVLPTDAISSPAAV